MLEHLDGTEFEHWCKPVFEHYLGCHVDVTQATADGGKDLIAKEPEGDSVIECKHHPNGSVGRPIVQKLHSAMIQHGAVRGFVVTTGKIADSAQKYVDELGLEIGLIDRNELEVIASAAGVPTSPSRVLTYGDAIQTIPTSKFEAHFKEYALRPRFSPARERKIPFKAHRATSYTATFIASYTAEGSSPSAVGRLHREWAGWVEHNESGTRLLKSDPLEDYDLAPRSEVLDKSPGRTPVRTASLNDAQEAMKMKIQSGCSFTVQYTGANNRTYRKTLTPSPRSIRLFNLKQILIPNQSLEIKLGDQSYSGTLHEDRKNLSLSESNFAECCICGFGINGSNQWICGVCCRPVHARAPLFRHGFECITCKTYICREHARRTKDGVRCQVCSKGGETPTSEWLMPLLSALLIVLVGVLVELTNGTPGYGWALFIGALGLAVPGFKFYRWNKQGRGPGTLVYPKGE